MAENEIRLKFAGEDIYIYIYRTLHFSSQQIKMYH